MGSPLGVSEPKGTQLLLEEKVFSFDCDEGGILFRALSHRRKVYQWLIDLVWYMLICCLQLAKLPQLHWTSSRWTQRGQVHQVALVSAKPCATFSHGEKRHLVGTAGPGDTHTFDDHNLRPASLIHIVRKLYV